MTHALALQHTDDAFLPILSVAGIPVADVARGLESRGDQSLLLMPFQDMQSNSKLVDGVEH